jgi:hypothetical protein
MAEHGKEILSMKIKTALLLALLFIWKQNFSQTSKPFAVVELFTSEGCSSCPPAEKVLSSIQADAEKNHKNIYCLEYHVDYWNRLGWKDPYSSFQYTLRQKNYTSVLNEESLYTPMMIVNGATAFTGSDAGKAASAIASALTQPQDFQIRIKVDSVARDTAYVSYQSPKTDKNFFIRAAITESGLSSKVGKGENSGRILLHDGVVRIFFSADVKPSAQLKIPLKKFVPGKKCILTAFIQHKQTMKILSVASVSF